MNLDLLLLNQSNSEELLIEELESPVVLTWILYALFQERKFWVS